MMSDLDNPEVQAALFDLRGRPGVRAVSVDLDDGWWWVQVTHPDYELLMEGHPDLLTAIRATTATLAKRSAPQFTPPTPAQLRRFLKEDGWTTTTDTRGVTWTRGKASVTCELRGDVRSVETNLKTAVDDFAAVYATDSVALSWRMRR
jgi:hypothetical protein